MSILIKGMEMPKNCGECPCYFLTEGAWRNECQVLHKEHNQFKNEGRPSWCPLIEIPPHGDLIDRNAAIRSAFKGEQNIYCWDEIEEAIDSVPTIIEAESE